jgi:hypothetical protein
MYSFIQDEDINGFHVVRPVTSNGDRPSVYFKHVHFPFGVNKDGSLKMDILDIEDEETQKNFRKVSLLFENAESDIQSVLDDSCTFSTRHKRAQKDLRKTKFNPSLLGHIDNSHGRMKTTIETRKGIPPAYTELKHYHASVSLYCDAFWIKDGVIFGGKWKIQKIRLQ